MLLSCYVMRLASTDFVLAIRMILQFWFGLIDLASEVANSLFQLRSKFNFHVWDANKYAMKQLQDGGDDDDEGH
jgi:hypothetical protein